MPKDDASVLFPDLSTVRAEEDKLSQKLYAVRQGYGERRATPIPLSRDWMDELSQKQFEETEDLGSLIDWVIDALDRGGVQMTHPGYLGLFNPSPTFPSECADRIVSADNVKNLSHF